jgi:hypothetical protein
MTDIQVNNVASSDREQDPSDVGGQVVSSAEAVTCHQVH